MMASVSEHLVNSLNELEKTELKEFQWHLKNENGISAAELENADVLDIVDKMMERYGPGGAVKITLNILRKMNQNQLAERLENKYKEATVDSKAADGYYTELSNRLKTFLKQVYVRILDGNSQTGHQKYLNDIFTDLFIVENETGGAISEHEVIQIELNLNRRAAEDSPIKCNDIFKVQGDRRNRKVLTMGIAGVGKTVSVNKFILDWAEGKENQEINFIFPFPFRHLNLIEEDCSLMELIHKHFSCVKQLLSLPEEDGKVMFIFDGLDEFRFTLSFDDNKRLTDVHEQSKVGVIVTNLIEKNLLPSSLIWITSRPAAANKIPRDYIDQVTEVRGFNDEQKEKYFTKNSNPDVAEKIISHMKKSRSLYIMCQIPVFCWISLSVLQPLLDQEDHDKIPTTLTGMYIYFLISLMQHMTTKNRGCDSKHFEHVVLKLGKLAFKQLQKENLIFYEEDLKKYGLDVSEGFINSGLCTQIFQTEKPVSGKNVYSFIHLSVQEFLAALYVIINYKDRRKNPFHLSLRKKLGRKFVRNPLFELHKSAIENALQSENGHLDLLLRFLMGLSLESNQNDLTELLPTLKIKTENMRNTVNYIKMKIEKAESAEKSINLFYCLNELKDDSLITEIQKYLNKGDLAEHHLSSTQWSALVFVLLMSEETQEMFEMHKYKRSDEALIRLLPVIKNTRRALLQSCNITGKCCKSLCSALQSSNSPLRDLDVSNNDVQDSGVKLISDALKSPDCKLHTLRLSICNLTVECCANVSLCLKTSSCLLRDLDISNNDLQDSGVMLISDALKSPDCKLEILRLFSCNLTGECCKSLSSCLQSSWCLLRDLDVSNNDLQDSGVKLISDALKSHNCKLHTLRLSICNLTVECCASLSLCLKSSSCLLRDLDLSNNDLQDSGVILIFDALKSQDCKLEILRLSTCNLTVECCESLSSSLQSLNSLKELDLSNNDLQDSGVKLISDALKSHNCKLEILRLSGCMVTDEGCCYLASALSSNPSSHLRELDLSYNHPQHSGRQMLSQRLNDPKCTLNKLNLDHGGEFRITSGLHKYACDLTLDPNTANPHLKLSENNRKVTSVKDPQPYPDHPDRFDKCFQVLCKESLTGRCYWEAEWSGPSTVISVMYKSIVRKRTCLTSMFKVNANSWCLEFSAEGFTAHPNNNSTSISAPSPPSKRVGVYLDWSAGTLSFYSVSDKQKLTHLHTFNATFTQPLYAGFIVFDFNSSVSLSQQSYLTILDTNSLSIV
ncbi:NACHT, LRR and PYD domains-containing protein 12 [Misgurnus anguillicaudatus]|uniref:NACHT, LRR and PYD domains-containing protein 12 n=1 Tax=Misgurnus anguillicaudatus TaxID=75329 RepID=UPI003CCF184B